MPKAWRRIRRTTPSWQVCAERKKNRHVTGPKKSGTTWKPRAGRKPRKMSCAVAPKWDSGRWKRKSNECERANQRGSKRPKIRSDWRERPRVVAPKRTRVAKLKLKHGAAQKRKPNDSPPNMLVAWPKKKPSVVLMKKPAVSLRQQLA